MTIQEEIRDRVIANIAKACPEMLNADIVKLADKILQGEASQGVVIKVDRELPSYLKELAELKSAGGNTYGLLCKFCGATCDITDDTFKFREQHEFCWAGYVAVEPLIKDDK